LHGAKIDARNGAMVVVYGQIVNAKKEEARRAASFCSAALTD
jgi:hypothetical protein